MSALEPRTIDLGVPGIAITQTGLTLIGEVTFGEWEQLGAGLSALGDMTKWALGDWLIVGEGLFGEQMAQAAEATGRSPDTLLQYLRVARKVRPSNRRPNLSWTHHQLVAAKPPEEQVDWLDRAIANRWSVPEMRGAISDRGLLSKPRRRRPDVEILELVQDVARAVLAARVRRGDGFSTIPDAALDRLANALGER